MPYSLARLSDREVNGPTLTHHASTPDHLCLTLPHHVAPAQRLQDRGFAFAEFRSVEEASNAMALDGLSMSGQVLKIR